ncbi:MAG: hypothetical protein A2Z15_03985 [Chloroflexi bacterium RBG_16_50_11]|nr:MAG: hypothetical protein A2Z15_03985 [Chloroflexi bacterium RBG_16_50_11]
MFFFKMFSKKEAAPVLSSLQSMISSRPERPRLGRYLSKGVGDLYQGKYDPHFFTGLGAALWVTEDYTAQPELALNALRQYVNYFFA